MPNAIEVEKDKNRQRGKQVRKDKSGKANIPKKRSGREGQGRKGGRQKFPRTEENELPEPYVVKHNR